MNNKQNILFFLLTILYIAKIFGTPPPPSPTVPPTTLIVSKFVPCNKNNIGKCLEVKVIENNKTEIISGIKNFTYDNNYIYKIKVKQINEPNYKYVLEDILEKNRKPDPDPTITLTILQSIPCSDNSNEECLLVKRLDKSKTETVSIKGFDYDKCYTYTLLVKELNESNFKYSLKKIVDKRKKSECDNPEYIITIEKDGLDDPNYINYTKEGETAITILPKEYYIGKDLKPGTRYVLKVKEVVKGSITYVELVKQIEPDYKPKGELTIIIEPFTDYHKIEYSYIKNGIETQETLDDTFIVDINLQTNIRYKLKVKDIGTDYTIFKLLKQIEPDTGGQQMPPDPGVIPYSCNGESKNIATKNDIIITDYILDNNNNIRIRKIDEAGSFYSFLGNICSFTYKEDHKYLLEVKRDGSDYILVKELCDTIMNFISNPSKKKYPPCENNNPNPNPPKPDTLRIDPSSRKPNPFKPKLIDDAAWYLRYLYQADALTPINNLEETSYVITFTPDQKKSSLKTPCGNMEANFIDDELGFFNFYNVNGFYSKCDETTKLLIEQLKTVKKYDLKDNVLKLSLNGKILIQLEGFPK